MTTVLFTTISVLISDPKGTQQFRSVQDIPKSLHTHLEKSFEAGLAGVIYIADKRGRAILEQSKAGQSLVLGRTASVISSSQKCEAAERYRHWSGLQLLLASLAGGLLWFLFKSGI